MKTIAIIISILQSIFLKIMELINVFTRKKEEKIRTKNIEENKKIEKEVEKKVEEGKIDDLNKDVGWNG